MIVVPGGRGGGGGAGSAPLAAIGVVIPVHNEEELLGPCLWALLGAMRTPGLAAVAIRVAVVLDGCGDRSGEIAAGVARQVGADGRDHVLRILEQSGGNVGRARHAGLCAILDDLRHMEEEHIWLATTDADSRVPPSWLAHQAAQRAIGIDAWAGTVTIEEWWERPTLEASFSRHYELAREAGHVHGASMGFGAAGYLRAGGFPARVTGEDHGLWARLGDVGASRLYDPSCPVTTSPRRRGRAPLGFAGALDRFEVEQEAEGAG